MSCDSCSWQRKGVKHLETKKGKPRYKGCKATKSDAWTNTCSASLPQGHKCGVAAWQWMLTTYDDYNSILHFYEHTCKSPLTASVFILFNIPDPFLVVSLTENHPEPTPNPPTFRCDDMCSKLKFHHTQPEPSPIESGGKRVVANGKTVWTP